MAVRRRLLTLAANSIQDTQSYSYSTSSSALLSKSTIGSRPTSDLSRFIVLNKFFKENCIYSSNTSFSSPPSKYGSFTSIAAAPNTVTKCWSCGAETPESLFLVCPSCKSVQPLDSSVNYFQIFNLEPAYDVDVKDLEKKYKDWQKKLHPDFFQCKSEQDKEFSAQQSGQVIKAYYSLLKPLSRAKYLLQLQGIDVKEEGTVTDSELLMEIMEVRESVEDAKNVDALKSIHNKMRSKLAECQMSFAIAYENRDFASAVSTVQKMSYYERVNEEIIKKL